MIYATVLTILMVFYVLLYAISLTQTREEINNKVIH